MTTLLSLTENDIRTWTGDASLSKGRAYFRDGSIINPRRQGDTLKAQCIGSAAQPYRVEITLGPTGITAGHCSCPVGDGGGCKHAAALLLTWVNKAASFTKSEELVTTLNQRSKEELIMLITKMIDRHPDLEMLLELPLPGSAKTGKPLDPKVFERQVSHILSNFDYEYGTSDEAAEQLEDLRKLGDEYAAIEDWHNAVVVYHVIAEGILDNHEMDENGELYIVVQACVSSLGEALAAVSSVPLRETILLYLFDIYRWDINHGGIDVGAEVPELVVAHATADEKQKVAQWVRAALPTGNEWSASYHRQAYGHFLLQLEADTLDDETFLRICRETGRVHDLVARLLSLQRVEEAVAAAEKASDYDLLAMTVSFTAHDQSDRFARLIAARAQTSPDRRLKEWLKERALKQGDPAAALKLSETMFSEQPSLAGYKEVKELAQQTKQWDAARTRLMAHVTADKRQATLLVQIYLAEGEIDQALKLVQPPAGQTSDHWGLGASMMRMEVAQAAEETRPRAALNIYLQSAKQLIANRTRGSYATAATHLARVRKLYQQTGDEQAWRTLIAKLREEHKNLRALQDELNQAKL